MTSYANFIRDFPNRCRDLLVNYEADAKGKDREVTLLIAVATSAFTIPFERLNPSSPKNIADDRYPQAVSALGRLQNRDFVNWQTGSSWKIIEDLDGGYIHSNQADVWADPDKWRPISANKKVGSVLAVLRNALAHGSIFTFPRPLSAKPVQIEDLVFLSRIRDNPKVGCLAWIFARFFRNYQITSTQLTDRYNAAKVSPTDFRTLILDWISFLEDLQLPSVIQQENI